MRTRVLQVLIVLAAFGLTAQACEKEAGTAARNPAVRETLANLLAGGSKTVTDGELAQGARSLGRGADELDTTLVATARETTVAERNVAAEAVEARAAERSVEDVQEQKEMLANACKVLEAVSPDSTPEQRRDALLGLAGAPEDESATAKFAGTLETVDNLANALAEGDAQQIQVVLACAWAES